MFNNIGEKIKKVASVTTIVGIVISCVVGLLILVEEEEILLGLGVAALGSMASWISMLTLYGFGHLIVQVDNLVKNSKTEE